MAPISFQWNCLILSDLGRLTHSQIANIIRAMIKGQDVVVLAALLENGAEELPYAELGKVARLSVSETHAAVKRLQEAVLLNANRVPVRRNVNEFLVHGLRYAFPLRSSGKLAKGLPTGYAAPVAASVFASTGRQPVWESSNGRTYGQVFEPIYPTAPQAAEGNQGLYDRLALIDMLRGGRIRERQFAEQKLKEILDL